MYWKLISSSFLLMGLAANAQTPAALKDAFKGYFHVGAALNPAQFGERDTRAVAIVQAQFDTITPENVLKWEVVHPRPDAYAFDEADRFVAFGEKHHMFIVGHTLVWHSQVPAWVFKNEKGEPLDRDGLLKRMRDHIQAVVGRYKGRIGGWDVVNEALNEDGTLRQTQWLKIIGEDYLVKAFQFAHEADPRAELYYNDYSVENPAKRKGAVELIRKLQAAGVNVAAIGLQGHDKMDWPTVEEQDATILAFKQLGIKVSITELDVDVLPAATQQRTADVALSVEAQAKLNPYSAGLPDAMQQALARRYGELFGVFCKYQGTVARVTFWGVTDGDSWLNNWPVRGRTSYPLLFDRKGEPKPAFQSVLRAPEMAERQRAIQADHQRLMDLLHITSLRRGRDGNNKQSPYYAHYDEAKANPFPKLPDPLVLKNGKPVKTAADWWKLRRPEIVEDFDREIYGRVPKVVPKVKWEVTKTTNETVGEAAVVTKTLVGHVDNSGYPQITVDIGLTLTTPANAPGPVPVVMEFGFGGFPAGWGGARGPAQAGPTWQQQVLAKGWGYAVLNTASIQADSGAGLTQGIIGLVNKGQPRKLDDWGSLRAWAWGASRALDYFETDKAVDAKRVALDGHSRYGKATLVGMAYDERFAAAFVSSSGEGGAKLHRRDWGEIVENVASTNEYHWMAGNFLKYAGPLNWDDLPVDSHELIAMCAPRPVFVSAGATEGDGWADAKGSFMAAAAAGPVYKLLGKKDMGTTEFPPIETGLMDGDVAFRQHAGGHTPTPNWPVFIAFAERYFNAPPSKR